MTEDFLQYIWRHRLHLAEGNTTSEGEHVEVLQPGFPNRHSGPDFMDARVRIGDTVWAGCVEIHLRSSDWERHGHHVDPAYNNVVLHAVYRHDADAYNARRQKIPVCELHFDARYFDNYNRLVDSKERVSCGDELSNLDNFAFASWTERLAVERLEQKAEAIMQTYSMTGNNWEETLYQRLARNFGFSLNALPFESLAKSLPLSILLKHRDNLQQLEALLFGQAGMLQIERRTPAHSHDDGALIEDDYYSELQKEYLFLQKKYNLEPIDRHLWKFLRLRPVNFPTLRIAQFAALMLRNERLFSQIIEASSVEILENIFDLKASEYWDTRYVFGKESPKRAKTFGITSVRTIVINTVAPFLFVYGKARGMEAHCARAIALLESLPPEKNSVLSRWEKLKARNSNAFDSQALLQLDSAYCQPKCCLSCAIGNRIVRSLL